MLNYQGVRSFVDHFPSESIGFFSYFFGYTGGYWRLRRSCSSSPVSVSTFLADEDHVALLLGLGNSCHFSHVFFSIFRVEL
jgi:hypothetical protein